MNTKYLKIGFGVIAGLSLLSSCVDENPFNNDGTALVKMDVTLNTRITRTQIQDDELKALQDKCVIYISEVKDKDGGGLLHKWIGIQNIPEDGIFLKYGNYVAEAWSGDSVSASFNSKFYKGVTYFSF